MPSSLTSSTSLATSGAITVSSKPKYFIGVSLPAINGICFDYNAGSVGAILENLSLVFKRLRVEEALAGKGDDTGSDAELVLEDLASLDGKDHLSTNADQGDIGILILDKDICTFLGTFTARVLRVLLKVLSGEGDDRWGVLRLQGGDKGTGRLLRVARPDVKDTYMLEVDLVFPDHVNRGRQISCANHEVLELSSQGVTDYSGRLSRRGGSSRQGLLGGDNTPPIFSETTLNPLDELLVELRVLFGVAIDENVPVFYKAIAAGFAVTEEGIDLIRDDILLVGIHAEVLLYGLDTFRTKGNTVSLGITSNLAPNTDDSVDVDECGLVSAGFGFNEGLDDTLNIVAAVLDLNHIPAASTHLGVDIFGVAEINATVAGDLVIVVHDDEVVELPVARQLDSFKSNSFLKACVSNHAVSHVIDEFEIGLVVSGGEVLGSHGETDCVGNALTERTGRHFNSFMLDFGMSWR
ncbi:hypothetical protein HG531_000651 [Fusarium graminearum]|nr:hypothetical protein HG531_000651 [Fusarium graminearum]